MANQDKSFWAILDSNVPNCLWEGAIGRIMSNPLSPHNNLPISFFIYNIFKNLEWDILEEKDYKNSESFKKICAEAEFELIRQREFPKINSRFSSFYLFNDQRSVNRAIRQWHHKKDHDSLKESTVECKPIFGEYSYPLDSDFIHFYLIEFKNSLSFTFSERKLNWIRNYWSGKRLRGKKAILEVLATGCFKIISDPVKENFRSWLLSENPNSEPLLKNAILLFEKDPYSFSTFLLATNFISKKTINNDQIELTGLNIIQSQSPRATFLSQEELYSLNEQIKANLTDKMNLPDFRGYNFNLLLPSDPWETIFSILKKSVVKK